MTVPNYGSVPRPSLPASPKRRLSKIAVVLSLVAVTSMAAVFVLVATSEDAASLPTATMTKLSQVRTEVLDASGGGTTASTCAAANTAMGSELFTFAALWLQKEKGCAANSEFVCSAAFDASGAGSTEAFIVQGKCGTDPTVILKVEHPSAWVNLRDNPAAGFSEILVGGNDANTVSGLDAGEKTDLEKLEAKYTVLDYEVAQQSRGQGALSHQILALVGRRMGYQPLTAEEEQAVVKRSVSKAMLTATTLPTTYNFVTDADTANCESNLIRDQEDCGSCYAFAASKAFSNVLCKKSSGKYNVQISEQSMVSCYNANGCGGGNPWVAWNKNKERGGMVTRWCNPYHHTDADGETDNSGQSVAPIACDAGCTDSINYKAQSFSRIQAGTGVSIENAVKQSIVEHGTAVAMMCVCPSFHSYSSGVYVPSEGANDCWASCGGNITNHRVNHVVAIVGWGSDHWIVANSWGEHWGESGYVKMAMGADTVLKITETYAITDIDACTGSSCSQSPVATPACNSTAACINGGSYKNDCTCRCPEGYSGSSCQTCSRQCQNGGQLTTGDCRCTCPQGTAGENCEHKFQAELETYDGSSNSGAFTIKFSWDLESFYPTSVSGRNMFRRYSSNDFNTYCNNCDADVAINGTEGTASLTQDWGFGWSSRPDNEHCHAAVLNTGADSQDDSLYTKVTFPCFYRRSNASYPGGYCIEGGDVVTDSSNPAYQWQCHTDPPPMPEPPACEPTIKSTAPQACVMETHCTGSHQIALKCENYNGSGQTWNFRWTFSAYDGWTYTWNACDRCYQ